jgi:hypothetical protein
MTPQALARLVFKVQLDTLREWHMTASDRREKKAKVAVSEAMSEGQASRKHSAHRPPTHAPLAAGAVAPYSSRSVIHDIVPCREPLSLLTASQVGIGAVHSCGQHSPQPMYLILLLQQVLGRLRNRVLAEAFSTWRWSALRSKGLKLSSSQVGGPWCTVGCQVNGDGCIIAICQKGQGPVHKVSQLK